jgi:hypothetical protein
LLHGLWPVGTCRSVRGHTPPPLSQPLEAPRGPRGENGWSGDTARRKRCLAGDLEPGDLATFLEIDLAQIGRKTTSRAVDAEGGGPGRVAESPASHSSRPGVPRTDRRIPGESSPVSSSGQADAHRGQKVGAPLTSKKQPAMPTRAPRCATTEDASLSTVTPATSLPRSSLAPRVDADRSGVRAPRPVGARAPDRAIGAGCDEGRGS